MDYFLDPLSLEKPKSSGPKLARGTLNFLSFQLTVTSIISLDLADEEPVDQKKYLEDSCKPKCVKQLRNYEACVKRIQGDETGHKHCTGQYFDYWSCIDKCVAPTLFAKLK
ncbi:hypothetical protein PTKIN_Ptkin10aG0174200 [Pterospermum kingtungense]